MADGRLVRRASLFLLAVAIAAGLVADRPRPSPTLTLNGYRVLAVDFHVHSSMWSDSAISPWGLVLEATRNGLDAFSMNGHNQVWDGKAARAFSEWIGGPTVITGQEIVATTGPHIIAAGIDRVVGGRGRNAAAVVGEIHRHGGIAIAAHPFARFQPAFDAAALQSLDGAELCHPMVYGFEDLQRDLETFASRGAFAAIGSSDYHGVGRMGMCRTYVFARDTSAEAILEAVRAKRTVVYGPRGRQYGDAELLKLAADYPELRERATMDPSPAWLDRFSAAAGLLGLLGLIRVGPPRIARRRGKPS